MSRCAKLCACAAAIALAGCDNAEEHSTVEHVATVDVAEAPMADRFGREAMPAPPPPVRAAAMEAAAAADTPEMANSQGSVPPLGGSGAVGVPQIAYRFAYGFRLAADAIKPLQERHADMCEARGPQVCRIISMKQAENEGDYSYGSLQVAVASKDARAFGKELAEASGKVDGELISSSIDGDDLSKAIVDTEARLRARTVLRDRLMEVLRTRKGTVAELVEAERGVAQVNEEIDQATSWLSEMKNRVAFSQMQVTYESGSPSAGGFIDPIRNAFGSIAAMAGSTIGFLITLLAVLVPLGLLGWLITWAFGRAGLSLPPTGWRQANDQTSGVAS